ALPIYRDFSVIEEHFQVSFLVDGVLEAFPGLALLRHFWEIFFYPREIGLHQWADAPLAAVPALFCRETLQLLSLPIDGLYHCQRQIRTAVFLFRFWQGFDRFVISPSGVRPASRDLQVFPFLFACLAVLIP